MDRGLGNFPDFIAPRKEGLPMDAEEIAGTVRRAMQDAIAYVDGELATARAEATDYYKGRPFGNEQEGRSQAVMTEVRDAIIGVVPSIIRVVHGPEHAVEFVPRTAEQVGLAEQQTDYVRWVYEEDNHGLLITHAVLKDALLKKLGIVKWGMDETPESVTTLYRGIPQADLELLLQDEQNQLASAKVVSEDGLFDVEIRRETPQGRIWVVPVPPDDFFWNREARSLDDAILVGHRMRVTRSELLKMGVSEDDIEEYGGGVKANNQTQEELARRTQNGGISNDVEMGPENRRILYCEVYMLLDVHGTGIAELRKICTIGDAYQPISNDPVDHKPFAVYCPDPEPHAFLGDSWYDRTKDMQEINSQLVRGLFDSLAISVFPRPTIVDGQVNIGDVMNNGIGTPVRQRAPGMIEWQVIPFAGDKILPVLGSMREVVERRIGNKDGAGSLDMDALQSTGKQAVEAAITAAQAQPELLARLFAEQFLKPLFCGLAKLAVHPLSKQRIIRLRGTYVAVDPVKFDPTMDVAVNVALGSMNTDKKVAILKDVISDQSAILQQFGPDNPVVSIQMLRNAKAKVLQLQGIKDVDAYYKPIPDNWQPPPPAPPEPTPDQLWIEAEKEMAFQKGMKELAIKQDELRIKEKQMDADLALRAREMELDAELRRYATDVALIAARAKGTGEVPPDRTVQNTDVTSAESQEGQGEDPAMPMGGMGPEDTGMPTGAAE